jgi:hypothetical protein
MKICDICFKKGSINDQVVVTFFRIGQSKIRTKDIDLCSECNDKGGE